MKLEIEGRTIATIPHGRNAYVPVRHLCDHLGLNTAAQVRRLKKTDWAELRFLPHAGGNGRSCIMAMIPVDAVPRFAGSLTNYGDKEKNLCFSAKIALHQRDGVRFGDIFAADEDTIINEEAMNFIVRRIGSLSADRRLEEVARRRERQSAVA